MGKPTGFSEWPREGIPTRPIDERVHDWRETSGKRELHTMREQAGRCMDCGVPFCHQGCPLGNVIPDWNDHVWRDRWQAAWEALSSTNNLPEVTGRVCPAPCEAACTLAIGNRHEAVTIENIEKELADHAFSSGWVGPRPRAAATGRRVAVVGSGPAGLAAADQLNRAGHDVTVLERSDRLGGLLRYGIPDFKLEKAVLDRRLAVLQAEGIRFVTGVEIGREISWSELRSTHDAILIATGASRPRDVAMPGRHLDGVVFAMDYLERQNRRIAGDDVTPISAEGKRVIVLGGGDTGSDCLGTALRQNAASVVQIELLPSPPEVRAADNPWPQWPVVFRVSSSQEEGGTRHFALRTTSLSGNGHLERLNAVRVQQRVENARPVLVDVPGTECAFDVDLLILALGFVGPATDSLVAETGIALDLRGNVSTDRRFRTTAPGIYAAGDAHRGASLVVWAIAEGREAARSIDADLMGRERLPSRGHDLPFGGR